MRELFATDLDAKIVLFHKAFDGPANLLTAVLRGHMMVEERLHDVISAGVAIYSRLFKENDIFTFGTAAKLAQAIIGSAGDVDLWKAVTSLNALRNAVGHRYEPARLDQLLTKFFRDTDQTACNVFRDEYHSYQHKGESEDTHALVVRLRCMAIWAQLGVHADKLTQDLGGILLTRR